jgi:murein L,D-transpeptidase YafK
MKKIALFVILSLLCFIIWTSYQKTPVEKIVDKPLIGQTADKIVVEKSARRLTLLSNGNVLKSYVVSLGKQPNDKKQREGDGRTPEGFYKIDYRNPKSAYHLSLHISYPNDTDLKNAEVGHYSAGNNIMIHGIPNGFGWMGGLFRFIDWTAGCIAVTDSEIEEIWQAVPDGTVIDIRP